MTTFKIGDKVEIRAGAVNVGLCFEVGSVGAVCGFDRHGWPQIEQGDERWYYHPFALRPFPALALGVRVRTTQDSRPSWLRGKEGVVTDWGEDAEPDSRYTPVVMDCDPDDVWYFEADELEVLPIRQPKAGEVWGCRGVFVGILTDTGGLLRSVNLETNRLYSADPLEPKHLLDLGFTYAAASVTEAVKKGLL